MIDHQAIILLIALVAWCMHVQVLCWAMYTIIPVMSLYCIERCYHTVRYMTTTDPQKYHSPILFVAMCVYREVFSSLIWVGVSQMGMIDWKIFVGAAFLHQEMVLRSVLTTDAIDAKTSSFTLFRKAHSLCIRKA